ncbi:hypothetical protein GJ496_007632 [Pomphorhynchus laevis]|nr:hypothetical protein GJ496_007632 [Pomphorhynchus laevis]
MKSRLTVCLVSSLPLAIVAVILFVKQILARIRKCKCVRPDGPCTVVLTGATGGIGQQLLVEFLRQDCNVIIGVRDMEKAKSMTNKIRSTLVPKCGTITILWLDLSFLKSVKEFVNQIETLEDRIDILVNNAAVFHTTDQIKLSIDGFEEHFQVNYLAPMLLCELLWPMMTFDDNGNDRTKHISSKIINITSSLSSRMRRPFALADVNFANSAYSPYAAYVRSKYALNLYTFDLYKRMYEKNIRVFSVHPGIVITPMHRRRSPNFFAFQLWRTLGFFLFNSPSQCARSIVHVCLSGHFNCLPEVMLKLDKPESWPINLHQPEFTKELFDFSRLVCLLPPI